MSDTGYRFIDDVAIADIAIQAWGPTISATFDQTARALTHVMVDDTTTVQRQEYRRIFLSHTHVERLLFDFLNELVYYKDAERLLLLPVTIDVEVKAGIHYVSALMSGELLDGDRHPLNADVKGVTLHRFRFEQTDTGWKAEVVLDV